MAGLELREAYAALAARQGERGEGVRERLEMDLAAARELVNGVNRGLGRGEDLGGLLEDVEGLVDRLEAELYLIQEIGLEAFVLLRRD